jgi:hypothetical protein
MEIVMKFNDAFWVIHVFYVLYRMGIFGILPRLIREKNHHFQSNSISPKFHSFVAKKAGICLLGKPNKVLVYYHFYGCLKRLC